MSFARQIAGVAAVLIGGGRSAVTIASDIYNRKTRELEKRHPGE